MASESNSFKSKNKDSWSNLVKGVRKVRKGTP